LIGQLERGVKLSEEKLSQFKQQTLKQSKHNFGIKKSI